MADESDMNRPFIVSFLSKLRVGVAITLHGVGAASVWELTKKDNGLFDMISEERHEKDLRARDVVVLLRTVTRI